MLRDAQIGGFDVQVLINPTSGEVQEGVEDFCTDRHPGDQLLIYFSCHGVLDSFGRLYYAAANTRRQRLAATAVAAAWLNERLEDCRARRQILVLDCCHSGAFAKGAKGDTDLALQQRFEPHGRGRVVLTASRSTEYSFEGGQASGEGVPSVFTHAIVNGLRTGEADRDRDGLITVTDLYQYVYDSVRAAEPRQTPELWTYGAEGTLLVAHSVRGAVIEPEPLPDDLRMTLESPRRRVRETGVAELADLLDAAGPGLALTARQVLERIAEEDQPQVATLARIAVDAPSGEATDQVRRELTDRAHQVEQARQEAEERARQEAEEQARQEAEEQARRQIEQLQQEIRERTAAQDWDAVVAASDELAALDPAAADPDGLASAAREQITRRQKAKEAAQQRRQIEQLQQKIRERAAAQDWDAVVAASDELAALDPITPAPLPPELQQATESPQAEIRAGAAQELARMLHGRHAGLALAARLALERLAEDDSRAVAAAAAAALGQQPPPPGPPPPELALPTTSIDFGRLTLGGPPPERRVRLGNAGGGLLNARGSTSASWLKLRLAGNELVIAVDTSAAGEHEGTVTIDSDGGSATIRVQAQVGPAPPPTSPRRRIVIATSAAIAVIGAITTILILPGSDKPTQSGPAPHVSIATPGVTETVTASAIAGQPEPNTKVTIEGFWQAGNPPGLPDFRALVLRADNTVFKNGILSPPELAWSQQLPPGTYQVCVADEGVLRFSGTDTHARSDYFCQVKTLAGKQTTVVFHAVAIEPGSGWGA